MSAFLVRLTAPPDKRLFAGGRGVTVAELPCAPCWRNQATPCMLTGGMSSECLRSLAAKPVIDTAVRLLRATEYPAASGTATIAET